MLNEPAIVNDELASDVAALGVRFGPILAVLRTQREALKQLPRLAVARPGYSLRDGVAEPSLVLAFHPPHPVIDAAALRNQFGVLVRATDASPGEQMLGARTPSFASALLRVLDPDAGDFAPPRRGSYQPPSGANAPQLEPIDETMAVTVCASPDAGWPVLRDFFRGGIKHRLVVAMYDFTAKHVEQALSDALDGTAARLILVIDGKPASGGVGGNGINGKDREEAKVLANLGALLGERFELVAASVGSGGAVPSAYHIKVAVADDSRVWLSSGNWQSSNLAPWDYLNPQDEPPFPLGRYNRDYHVVVHNASLARTYAGFIEYDATLGGDYAGPTIEAAPALLIPVEAEQEDFAPARRFKPKTFSEQIRVTPLLTPDNFPGMVNKLLAGAKTRVWLQNQYIQPNEDGDNFPEFDRLLATLGTLARRNDFDLRLCLRSPDEPYRDRLLAAGIPAACIRRQKNCHAKLIIIDGDVVVVGSQNLSNAGFVANRDASLAFEHAPITAYFSEVFEADWERATPIRDDDTYGVRVADPEGEVPAGWVKVPWGALYDTPPPRSVSGPLSALAPAAATTNLDLPFFGVDADTGKRMIESSAAVAAALKKRAGSIDVDRVGLGKMLDGTSFAVPPGIEDQVLSDTGWGVIWGPSVTPTVKAALKPLLDLRRTDVGAEHLFHEFDYQPSEDVRKFLQRNGADYGSVNPESVPYYLLLVGTPEEIPFSFQTLLDVEYRVGRLDLSTPDAYAQYARSVVQVETGVAKRRERILHAFGPAHPGDAPTKLSVNVLVAAAQSWLDTFGGATKKHGLGACTDAGDKATRARLDEILRGANGRPELLFTAGHGLACGAGSVRQAGEQGALITADWDGFSPIDKNDRYAASDVPADADLLGMIAFLFACYGLGTPATDNFPTRAGQELAPKAFSAALPKALLSHVKGGCLGVFGHIDRTLTWSLQPPHAPVATAPFAHAALHVLVGSRLGTALDDLNQRGATLAANVAMLLRPGAMPQDDVDLVSMWTQQRDASTFVLMGDPAARLPR